MVSIYTMREKAMINHFYIYTEMITLKENMRFIIPDDELLRSVSIQRDIEEKLTIFQCANDVAQLRLLERLIDDIAIMEKKI